MRFKRIQPTRRFAAGVSVGAMLFATMGIAAADTVNVSGGNVSVAQGGTGTASFYLLNDDNSTDPVNGCNAEGTTVRIDVSTLSAHVAIDAPGYVTVAGCGSENAESIGYTVAASAPLGHVATITAVAPDGTAAAPNGRTHQQGCGKDCTTTSYPTYQSGSFTVTVTEPIATCAGAPSSAPAIAETNDPDAVTGWYNASSADAGFTVDPSTNAEYSLDGGTTWTAYAGSLTLTEDGTYSVVARNFTPADGDCVRVDGPSSGATPIRIDRTAPAVTPGNVVNTSWRNTELSEDFEASDTVSGLADDDDAAFTLTAAAESTKVDGNFVPTVDTKTVLDLAGNSTTRSVSALIDLTAPDVGLVGGPDDDATYSFGLVPAGPTCEASDALSGLVDADPATPSQEDCLVSGYSTAVGTHTVTAEARDVAGNEGTDEITYTVQNWTVVGFHSPVTMDGSRINAVKGGSAVPLKFNVYRDPGKTVEITSMIGLTSVNRTVTKIKCDPNDSESTVSADDTGGTTLRYENGSFIWNWKSPTTKGCYVVAVNLADGSVIETEFRVR